MNTEQREELFNEIIDSPEKALNFLRALTTEEGFIAMIEYKGYDDNTILHSAFKSSSTELIKAIVQKFIDINIASEKLKGAFGATNISGNSPLKALATNLDNLKALLEVCSDEQLKAVLTAQNENEVAILHESIGADAAASIFARIEKVKKEEDRKDIMKSALEVTNQFGEPPLLKAILEEKVGLVKKILEASIQQSVLKEVIEILGADDESPLHAIFGTNNEELIAEVLKLVPADILGDALIKSDISGKMPLDIILKADIKAFEAFINNCDQTKLTAALVNPGNTDNTLLHKLAKSKQDLLSKANVLFVRIDELDLKLDKILTPEQINSILEEYHDSSANNLPAAVVNSWLVSKIEALKGSLAANANCAQVRVAEKALAQIEVKNDVNDDKGVDLLATAKAAHASAVTFFAEKITALVVAQENQINNIVNSNYTTQADLDAAKQKLGNIQIDPDTAFNNARALKTSGDTLLEVERAQIIANDLSTKADSLLTELKSISERDLKTQADVKEAFEDLKAVVLPETDDVFKPVVTKKRDVATALKAKMNQLNQADAARLVDYKNAGINSNKHTKLSNDAKNILEDLQKVHIDKRDLEIIHSNANPDKIKSCNLDKESMDNSKKPKCFVNDKLHDDIKKFSGQFSKDPYGDDEAQCFIKDYHGSSFKKTPCQGFPEIVTAYQISNWIKGGTNPQKNGRIQMFADLAEDNKNHADKIAPQITAIPDANNDGSNQDDIQMFLLTIQDTNGKPGIQPDEVLKELEKMNQMVDEVTVTGGDGSAFNSTLSLNTTNT